MALRAESLKRDLIEAVVALAKERLDKAKAAQAEPFVRKLYDAVPPDDLVGESPEDLYGAALSLLGFARKRKPGEAKVRVLNPRVDEHGWHSAHTVVEIVNEDMPFLVDSVTAELTRREAEVLLVVHPIVCVERDAKGELVKLDPKQGAAESMMHIEVVEQPRDRLEEIEAGIHSVLDDVRAAVEDWAQMRDLCRKMAQEIAAKPPKLPAEEVDEGIAFLEWMAANNFTFLGYRDYSFEGSGDQAKTRVEPGSGLGVLRNEKVMVFDGLRNLSSLSDEVRDFLQRPRLIRITKANSLATVHRSVNMDTVAIKRFDAKGKVIGERLFAGLFTSTAYARSPEEIPVLRRKLRHVIAASGFEPESHNAKNLAHILETYPRDELFQIGREELKDTALGILGLQERHRIALFVRRDPFERFVSCLCYVPRDRYDTRIRQRFQEILAEAYQGEPRAFYTYLTDEKLARIHFIIRTSPGGIPEVDTVELERKLQEAGRSWSDRLRESLIESHGEERGLALLRRFQRAFPAGYQEHYSETQAVFDIARIEEALAGDGLAMNLYRPIEAEPHQVHFKLYVAGGAVPLSDVLPMLENMGLRVLGEVPFNIRLAETEGGLHIHDFNMESEDGMAIDLSGVKEAFHDAFAKVWRGDIENDGFNKLVIRAGLTARRVQVLRAYCKYLRQASIPFSQVYMEDTLKRNPELARLLVELFLALFDPKAQAEAAERSQVITAEILARLEEVSNLDEDRIIRRFLNVILFTLRTSYFQRDAAGETKATISFKLDSRNLDELPLPRPFREIYVYGPRIEGVHLRFGKVARGGLRWSDRFEDFRTEILGLVKAQQVKNAVIVPVGSKGGFVVKRPPPAEAGREAYLAEGVACYRLFINALLDITDNLTPDGVVPPADVLRRDEDDPYLVVAADKGTATFSDYANAVSQEHGFWLDDAFASGGSAGYDHKKMGITAKGAWESVKRHFREVGKDIQNEDFTCVGVGDMSGDVFGNGMLLSKHIKLLAAFNHLHIFIDPDPDPAASWAERKRLFDLPRSNWSDYDASLISKGGAIIDRKAKSVKISPEAKAALGLEKTTMTPNELLHSILQANVELLWFGGIGTYVKASDETNAEAGDRANDAIRVNGREVGAAVVGEGANLGMTQRARIEYGLAGGRGNTDAIDNSAGVDCSDHEVNIKILLGAVEQSGDMTRKQRDKLLAKMTDEVGELVLRDNYLQSQAISVTYRLGAHLLDRLARFMRVLEKQDQLNRAVEYLPDDEMVLERSKAKIGLTRPEISVLLSYAKIVLYDELLESDLPDDPLFLADLRHYFPKPLQKDFGAAIEEHRLRREIIATVVTNHMVNRVGVTFVHEVQEKTGLPPSGVARAYRIACEIFEMESLWSAIESLDNQVPADAQAAMLAECGRLVERETVWFLREASHPLDTAGLIRAYGPGVKAFAGALESVIGELDRQRLEERSLAFQEVGAPVETARRVASLALLAPACDVVRLASQLGQPVEEVAAVYFKLGSKLGFDWLRRAAGGLPSDSAWDKLAVTAIIDDFYGHQAALTGRVLQGNGHPAPKGEEQETAAIEAWSEGRRPQLARTEQLLAELRASAAPDLAMLAVANRQLKSLVGG